MVFFTRNDKAHLDALEVTSKLSGLSRPFIEEGHNGIFGKPNLFMGLLLVLFDGIHLRELHGRGDFRAPWCAINPLT